MNTQLSPSNDLPLSNADKEELTISLISLTKKLTEVISLENKCLKENRPHEVKNMVTEKNQLSLAYQSKIKALAGRGGLKSIGKADVIREFKQVTAVFNKTLEKHFTLIKALKTISENMINAISDEVNKQNGLTAVYGANAQMRNNYNSQPTNLSYNKEV